MLSKPLKIAHITRAIDPVGGCEIYIRNLAEFQDKSGHRVSIITAYSPESSFKWHKINIPDLASYKHQSAKLSVNKLAEYLSGLSPDLVHIHDLNNPYAIRFCGQNFPTVKSTLNADVYCGGIDKYLPTSKKACEYRMGYGCLLIAYYENCMRRNPKRALEIISLKKKSLQASQYLAAHVVPSDSSKKILIQNGVSEHKIRVVPLFSNFEYPKESICPHETKTILFVGRLRAYKGTAYLIRALAKIKTDFKAFIVGEGEEKGKLVRLTHQLNLNQKVEFTGSLPHSEVSRYFEESSIVVVPSIYPDSFPTVGLEAMAYRKPVIGFQMGGIPVWLEDGKTGYLVKTQDVNELAQKLELLLLNPELAQKMGQAGFERFSQHYTESVHENLIDKLYTECLAHSPRQITSAR